MFSSSQLTEPLSLFSLSVSSILTAWTFVGSTCTGLGTTRAECRGEGSTQPLTAAESRATGEQESFDGSKRHQHMTCVADFMLGGNLRLACCQKRSVGRASSSRPCTFEWVCYHEKGRRPAAKCPPACPQCCAMLAAVCVCSVNRAMCLAHAQEDCRSGRVCAGANQPPAQWLRGKHSSARMGRASMHVSILVSGA